MQNVPSAAAGVCTHAAAAVWSDEMEILVEVDGGER
jgi:hypothetical protein